MFNAIMGTYWGGLLNFTSLYRQILIRSFRADSIMGAFTRDEDYSSRNNAQLNPR